MSVVMKRLLGAPAAQLSTFPALEEGFHPEQLNLEQMRED